MPTARHGAIELAYETFGGPEEAAAGEPLLLIHRVVPSLVTAFFLP